MTPEAEFTFACPVCHQHIKAPTTAAGVHIECPTCFQQIIIPKAPGGETTKLILRATQAGKAQTRYQPQPSGQPPHTKKNWIKRAALLALGTIAMFALRH